MIDDSNDTTEESILYEVLEYFVQKQEPELTVKLIKKCKNGSVVLQTSGTIKNALRYLNNRYSLPKIISQQISYTLPWKFAVGNKGRILAIIQDNIIEIRKSKDEYSSIIGKASAPKDAFPQWRKLAWNPDGSILVLASSNGYISFYNLFGNNIFNINPKSVSQNPHILEAGDAIASIIFRKPKVVNDNYDYEFIRVTYSGLLKSYYIFENEFRENHEFSFGNFYANGVNSVTYSDKYNLFFVAGNSISQNLTCTASQIGLTCWRTINNYPYYVLFVSSQDSEIYTSPFSIWNFIPIIKSRTQSIIFKTSISPNNHLISCLHTDGTISIWNLPTLKLQKQWKLFEQPNYNATNPLKTNKIKKSFNNEFHPVDVGWWSDNTIIIARYSGSVSVCSIYSLQNLLGSSPEFLYNHPQIGELSDSKGFLCLDCEVIITNTMRNRESNNDAYTSELSSDSDKDEDESKPVTILNYTTNLMQSALYSITDIEQFQPKRKKFKIFHKSYRLLGLKSTTPEELYLRKIEIEEYEEALTLAATYNLDPDLVYQTQWRKSEFSIDAVQKYLSKVTKRSWVLNECISRVSDNLEATRALINFGLRCTNLETLIAIGIDDNGKFTSFEINNHFVNNEINTQLIQMQKINQILDAVTNDNLNESQKELIRYRKQLLNHLDKLKIYEILLESSSNFDKKFYEEFRQLSPVENSIKFAKCNNSRGVEIMFTYYGNKLMCHWLSIITFFPETLNPEKYQKLLPECDVEGRLFLLYQEELRQKDWIERNEFSYINFESNNNVEFIYESRRSLLIYRNKELTQDLLQKWYKMRAYEIERESRLIDNALALINIGKSHNIKGLESLLFELETLADLVYKVNLEELSLTEIETLSDLEKIKLLMMKCNENNLILNIKNMLLPYSRRRDKYIENRSKKNLLCEYLIYLSEKDLTLTMKFFEFLKSSYDFEILDSVENITELAINCIYACTDTDMYLKAKTIFDTTVTHTTGREESSKKYKELEKELKCLHILNKYQVKIPLIYIIKSKRNFLDAKTLIIKMSENLSKIYSSQNEKYWSQLLNDILEIQKVFSCLDIETCFQICMIARLKSGSKTVIQGCTNLIENNKNEETNLKVSYKKAVNFILQASNNYFNNSKSLDDPDMELAKECLHLITDNDERIKEEYDLIESLRILNEFQINILPLQVRMASERLKFIEDYLNSRNDAYKNKQKLLDLSKFLRIEKKNSRLRDSKIFNLIARKAFELNDYNFCAITIKEMMENNYQLAWNIALDLAYCNKFDDLKFRLSCTWFVINNGPSNIIENLMKLANLLQLQFLNIDLEKWIPANMEYKENSSEANLNDEFNLLRTKTKEFVPQIVQTSTELIKISAQIVKQSSCDLIKNAGNKDFWKFKFNLIFNDNSQKEITENEMKAEKIQKFPCFYETLHKNCGISNLDTKYFKYSQIDYNIKLKLYQSLLRILLLNKTALYETDISNVNNLLLECAEYTLSEDCNMAVSYLLNLDDNYVTNILSISKKFSQIQIHSQILAYFYSIKIYLNIYSDCNKTFFYDPIELIYNVSKMKICNDNEDEEKLKQEVNLLILQKKETINKLIKTETQIENVNQSRNILKQNFSNNELKAKEKLTLDYIETSEEIVEWSNWNEEWETSDCTNDNADKIEDFSDVLHFTDSTLLKDKYFEVFEKKISEIQIIDDYKNMKNVLIKGLNLNNLKVEININYDLTSKLIIKLIQITKNNNIDNEKVLIEIKDLLQEKLISQKMFVKFLQMEKDNFTHEQRIYLQLCSKELSLQKKAINYIKENYKTLTINTAILEEIFFNNLTYSFSVSHDLYYGILEEVFKNRTLPEIESNVKLLIKNLVEQKNIPHAIALFNQLEGIPPLLSTYENCFQLLLLKGNFNL